MQRPEAAVEGPARSGESGEVESGSRMQRLRNHRSDATHQVRRREIAQAACEVILQVGLDKMRLADVAREAGLTTGAIQYHFESKEELLLFVKNGLFDRIFAAAEEQAQQLTGPARLRAYVRNLLPIQEEVLRAFQLLEAFRGRAIGNPELLSLQHERDAHWLGKLTRELRTLQGQGHISAALDPEVEALTLNALIDGLGALVVVAPAEYSVEKVTAVAEGWFSKCLGLPPAPPGVNAAP